MTLKQLINFVLVAAIFYYATSAIHLMNEAKGIIDKLTSDWAQEQRSGR